MRLVTIGSPDAVSRAFRADAMARDYRAVQLMVRVEENVGWVCRLLVSKGAGLGLLFWWR